MLTVFSEKLFQKAISKAKKSGLYSSKDFDILKEIVLKLANEQEIEEQYKRHKLKGTMKNFECIHLKNDWLLIFTIEEDTLYLSGIGTHTQVYNKF